MTASAAPAKSLASVVIQDIEVDAAKVLGWLSKGEKLAPAAATAVAVVLGQVGTALAAMTGAAANPLNIPLDIQTVQSLMSIWPTVKTELATLGIKLP
jgi:hypothetical protein